MVNFGETFTGKKFVYENPTVDMICLEDIASGLSKCCRYAGQCKDFYSVAQHSVLISIAAEMQGLDIHDQRWGLMHDASEAYIGDMNGIMKLLPEMAGYRVLEIKIMTLVSIKFNLIGIQEPSDIKMLDSRILADEKKVLFDSEYNIPMKDWELPYIELGFKIKPLGWAESKELFLARAKELSIE